MPPFVDQFHLHQAVHNQAVPALEAIAANDNLRSLSRFERDDPPPYVSSTESGELDDADLIPLPRRGPMPEELKALMDQPLSEFELNSIATTLDQISLPDEFYYTEAHRELARFDRHALGPQRHMFIRLNGVRREGVIVRHLVKWRWQKLGVWNPSWGFAGRKVKPSDDWTKWIWWWQPMEAANGRQSQFGRELVARALRLRKNLRRGEYVPSIPRSRLSANTTASEAEAFLISRPWFIFQIEVAEEIMRYHRLSPDDRTRYRYSGQSQVIKWWKERGDWREEFNRTSTVTSWKWRHESPSPEPEDLAPVAKMKNSPLDAAEEMEFTPSEIDELETIDLPESEQPEGFWVIKGNDIRKNFPGEMVDQAAEARERLRRNAERVEKLKAEGRYVEPPRDPVIERLMKRFGPNSLFDPPPAAQCEEIRPEARKASRENQEDEPQSQGDVDHLRPQAQRRLPQHRVQSGVDSAQDQDRSVPPLPRRSSRIAAMKRRANPLPAQTGPNKRRAATNAAAPATSDPAAAPVSPSARAKPVPAQCTPKKKSETRPRGRGLAGGKSGPSIDSAVGKRRARTFDRKGTRNRRGTRAAALNGEQRRLRSRQDK